MNAASDHQLLRAYAERRDEAAFRELVQRHTDLVYSAALRQVNSDAAARDLTQSVFTDLARRAQDILGKHTGDSLASWLHRATRYAALNHLRDARRRHENERQAMEQLLTNSDPAADWEQIRPALDEALDSLDDTDREALLLRYFKNQDFRTVGVQLGVSDDAAQKRVSRAVDKLRDIFSKKKITVGAGSLGILISANAVQAAPVGLAITISTAALAGTAATTSTLIAATTKTVAMTTLQKTLVTATVAVLAGAGIYEAHQAAQLRDQVQTLQQQQAPLAEQIQQLQQERDDATNRLADVLAENARLGTDAHKNELLKLRGVISSLRQENSSLKAAPQALAHQQSSGQQTYSTNVVPRETWRFAGYNTPSATVQSMIWAKSTGDFQAFLNSVSPTIVNDVMNGYHAEQSPEQAATKLLQETKGVKSLQIVGEMPLDEDTVIVQTTFQVETDHGETKQDTLQMLLKRINGEWKYANQFVPRH